MVLGTHRRDGAGGAGWLDRPPAALATGTGAEVAARLAADARASGATALNVRIDVDGADHAGTVDQVAELGATVLPSLRACLPPVTAGG